jgi:hypothetical protein
MMYASDDKWDEFLLMPEVHEEKKTVDASALGIEK